jgi:hypothetical protein
VVQTPEMCKFTFNLRPLLVFDVKEKDRMLFDFNTTELLF